MTKSKSFQSQSLETDLIDGLFSPDTSYPWNPADPESEKYFLNQEQQFHLNDWSEAEVKTAANSFFTQLGSCWPDTPSDLVSLLRQKFATRIPENWLAQVATVASQVANQQISTASQLVGCVQELLPAWAEEDLLVLARPYVYAMRSDANPENSDSLVPATAWEQLSEMEQAKLTMLVTKYALDQLVDNVNE